MASLQKIGGLSALVEAIIFILGFFLYFTLLASASYGSLDIDPIRNVIFLVEHKALMHAWNFIIYVMFGIFLVILTLALYERLKTNSPALMQVAAAFGLIWSVLVIASGLVANIGAETVVNLYEKNHDQAISAWLTLQFVVNGLGGGNEIIGGIWLLLVSLSGYSSAKLPKALNIVGLVVGSFGIATCIPGCGELGAVFGLGIILWFVWLGLVMLLDSRKENSLSQHIQIT